MDWLLYGANGYTGRLVARLAVARGQRPVLAGRAAGPVAALAAELGLEHRVFDLADPAAVRAGLAGMTAVAHCAGPFSATATPMVDACLATGVHYLDITGEIEVFEALHARTAQARQAGVVLLPGGGFDVVPTDCLAATVAAAVPGATHLDLAFVPGGGISPGTALTALAGLRTGTGKARVNGVIQDVPLAASRLRVEFPSGQRTVTAIPWGDVSTAYHSTGIPTITTYAALPGTPAALGRLLRWAPLHRLATAAVRRFVPGPSDTDRAGSRAEVWARAAGPDGAAHATLVTPNPYDLTADAVVTAMPLLAELPPGTHTPVTAFGAPFVTRLAGVTASGPHPG